MNRLTPRERLLTGIVLGILFALGNLSVLSALKGWQERLRSDIAAKRSEIKSMSLLLAESEASSASRDAWIRANQPKLTNPEQAGVQLLDQIREIARSNEVVIENPELGGLETQSACRSVSVQLTTKSSWSNLVRFLHAMQQPGRFIVFETATLQVDPANASQMACRFKIAKWIAL